MLVEAFCVTTPLSVTSGGSCASGLRDPVLDVDRGDVGVGADLEGDVQRIGAGVGGLSTDM